MLLKLRDRFCRIHGRENYTHTRFAEWLVHDEPEFATVLLAEYLGELTAEPSVERIYAKDRDAERIPRPSRGMDKELIDVLVELAEFVESLSDCHYGDDVSGGWQAGEIVKRLKAIRSAMTDEETVDGVDK